MKIYKHNQEISGCRIEVLKDQDNVAVFNDSKIKIYTDLLGAGYKLEKQIIICEIIWQDGGFHAINLEIEWQFPLWQIPRESVKVLK